MLFAALMHATWNVLLKTASDPLRTAGRSMFIGACVLVPVGLLGWGLSGQPAIPGDAWRLSFLSGLLEAAYFILLSAAYRRGDLSLVYPIARGTAPVLAVGAGVLILGERLELAGWIGVALLLVGILGLQKPWAILRRGSQLPRHTREAAGFALLTGVTIASYSAVDRDGARLVNPLFYAAMLQAFMTMFLLAWIGLVILRERSRPVPEAGRAGGPEGLPEERPEELPEGDVVGRLLGHVWLRAGIGGLITVAAYLIVLVAYRYAPLTAVAPLRESAIVVISGWGTFRLKEAVSRRDAGSRIGLAVIVLVGAILLAAEG
ncbi:MAG: EamA family transporter [Candidatus Limnocylindrales bacterium]